MSGTTTRIAPGWRFVATRAGDTLQAIAFRELGDAARWADLASLNGLVPPYLTADPREAAASGGKVRLHGDSIRVFSATAASDAQIDPEDVFDTDIGLTHGRMTVANGDYALLAGLDNLKASLARRVTTPNGELLFHPGYGSQVRALLGRSNGPVAAALAGRSVQRSLAQDGRVERVASVTSTPQGDRLAIQAVVVPISSAPAQTISVEFF